MTQDSFGWTVFVEDNEDRKSLRCDEFTWMDLEKFDTVKR